MRHYNISNIFLENSQPFIPCGDSSAAWYSVHEISNVLAAHVNSNTVMNFENTVKRIRKGVRNDKSGELE